MSCCARARILLLRWHPQGSWSVLNNNVRPIFQRELPASRRSPAKGLRVQAPASSLSYLLDRFPLANGLLARLKGRAGLDRCDAKCSSCCNTIPGGSRLSPFTKRRCDVCRCTRSTSCDPSNEMPAAAAAESSVSPDLSSEAGQHISSCA